MTLLPNPLLLSQLQHAWGLASSQDVQRVLQAWPPLAPGAVEAVSRQQAAAVSGLTPDEVLRTLPSLLAQVNSTYALMEQDLAHSRHSLEMRSAELTQANQRLQEEARQQLKESEERLALAVQGSNIGLWDWDLQTDEVYFSAEWAAMLGYAVHDLAPTASTLVGLLHPDDGKRFGQALGVYFEHDTTEMYRDDVRLRCKDGSYKWVEFKGRIVQCAPDGQPLRATGVSLDISARKAWEQGVADARDAAEAASRAKGDFLANMSHEIRTPMNGILGLTQLCLSTTLDDEQRGYLDMVHASARSLLTVINDVLDFSKIEARKLDIEAVVFHLPQVVRHAAAPLAHTAQERALSLLAEVDAELPPWRVGDPGRLRQVLLNLVGNAVKFTERGEVRLRVGWAPEASAPDAWRRLRFSVSDTGIGIAPEQLDSVFEAFSQADTSISRRFGGTGLGLSISARLIALMGGTLQVRSTVGQGSEFWFDLDLPVAAAPPLDESPLGADIPKGLRVLVAEDHPINQVVARKLLEFLGLAVTVVDNGRQAVEACAAQRFDLVFMDIQMPELDGFAATRRIRAFELPLQRHTPIVAMTAHAMDGYRERCVSGGMDGYVTKPVDRQQLVQEMARVLALWPPGQSA